MTDTSLRPSLLDPLFAPARTLPGVGPKVAPLIEKLLGTPEREARIVDLLFHLPQGASRAVSWVRWPRRPWASR